MDPAVVGAVAAADIVVHLVGYEEVSGMPALPWWFSIPAAVAAGATVAVEKQALPGMAWQGYFVDTEGNVFGVHQPDPEAR